MRLFRALNGPGRDQNACNVLFVPDVDRGSGNSFIDHCRLMRWQFQNLSVWSSEIESIGAEAHLRPGTICYGPEVIGVDLDTQQLIVDAALGFYQSGVRSRSFQRDLGTVERGSRRERMSLWVPFKMFTNSGLSRRDTQPSLCAVLTGFAGEGSLPRPHVHLRPKSRQWPGEEEQFHAGFGIPLVTKGTKVVDDTVGPRPQRLTLVHVGCWGKPFQWPCSSENCGSGQSCR